MFCFDGAQLEGQFLPARTLHVLRIDLLQVTFAAPAGYTACEMIVRPNRNGLLDVRLSRPGGADRPTWTQFDAADLNRPLDLQFDPGTAVGVSGLITGCPGTQGFQIITDLASTYDSIADQCLFTLSTVLYAGPSGHFKQGLRGQHPRKPQRVNGQLASNARCIAAQSGQDDSKNSEHSAANRNQKGLL